MNSEAIASATRRIDRRKNFAFSYDSQAVAAGMFDTIAIIAASLLAGLSYNTIVRGQAVEMAQHIGTGLAVTILFIPLAGARGAYSPQNLLSLSKQIQVILFAWLYVISALLGFAFVAKVSLSFSRGTMILLAGFGPVALVLARLLHCRVIDLALRTGRLARRRLVLIADSEKDSGDLLRSVQKDCNVDRIFTLPRAVEHGDLITIAQEVVSHVRRSTPDAIHIALSWHRWNEIKTLAEALRAVPLPVRLIPDTAASGIGSYPSRNRTAEFALELQREPLTPWELRSKRALDVLLSGLALFLLSPLLVVIAIAIRLDSPGPVLFQQQRRGFNGQIFAIYKFRSMSVLENGSTVRQATRDDPRVTRVGRWLRRSSLDELPQLINVLLGNMSLVGPRPHAVAHDDQYTQLIANYAFRHHVNPGITGWAQVNGHRGETPTVETMQCRIDHDLWYIANWSLRRDILILLKTAVRVFRMPDAY